MNDTIVGPDAVVRRAILDKNVKVEKGAVLDLATREVDPSFTISDRGVVVVGKGGEVLRT
jgi:glucose-1-phosphate adenylyltransferase